MVLQEPFVQKFLSEVGVLDARKQIRQYELHLGSRFHGERRGSPR